LIERLLVGERRGVKPDVRDANTSGLRRELALSIQQEDAMTARLIATVALVALILPTGTFSQEKKPAEAGKNLIVNGSFEEGPEPGGFKSLDEGSTDIKGWKVIRGQIDYIGSYWKSADGQRSLDLHGSPGFGGVSQTFKTKKGQKYRVTFSMAGNPEGGPDEKKLGVSAAGKKAEFTFDAAGKTKDDMGWATKTWDFTATDDETTLEIYTLLTENDACGPTLDNVAVRALKE
jgi:choice-of-anchor C domain-containing protein